MNKTKDKYKFTIHTKVTPEIYRNFAKFETFTLRKRWIFPLFIACNFLLLAGIFYMAKNGLVSNILAVVSVIFGIGIPIIYFRTFARIIRDNTHNAPYDAVIDSYMVSLTDEGVEFYSETEQAECTWEQLFAAYCLSNCIVLCPAKGNYFLVTEPDPKRFQTIWDYICDRSGRKAKDRRSAIA